MSDYVYGPVPSRRLGRSLGVDLVPQKTCPFNCIYCQLGPTPETTLERKDYIPVNDVVAQVKEALAQSAALEYITLAGSGEPTLHNSFGRIASQLKLITEVPIALLTNGSLFHLPEVRQACRDIDVVLPSLDAGNEEQFRYINRPHEGLTLDLVVAGLARLREEFDGLIWLEVFILLGVNSFDADIERMKRRIEEIRPDKIQINTAVRPTAEDFAYAVPLKRLEEIACMLGPNAEVIADVKDLDRHGGSKVERREVLAMLRRRPCTADDVANGLGIHRNEAIKFLQGLMSQGVIKAERSGDLPYYLVKR